MLEARRLKETLKGVAENLKNYGLGETEDNNAEDDEKKKGKKGQRQESEE